MRSLIVNNIVSLDGFYADENGNPVVLTMDQAFDAYNLERLRSAGTVLLGRTSFEGFGGYWPFVADAPQEATNRALSQDNREISRIYNSIPKVVVSDSLEVPAAHPWAATTTVIGRGDVGQWLAHEQRNGTGDIIVFASRLMWNGLLTQGLIDELHLTVSPVALAAGQPLFLCPIELSLMEARAFPGSGNVLLRYRPAST
ncbi:dihydrofolate reductase family protein [Kocuria sp. CPCC 205263]|uniref:dihydrofolate reductase family protein n=1 Tax=Kocuria sp. CPCC 205263 TaxID=3073555 RepID=UPI0034D64813